MGAGLALHEQKPGRIIIFAGGTGVYPYIDTFDILYKKLLCDQKHNLKNKIRSSDPAVDDPHLNSFQFMILASFN